MHDAHVVGRMPLSWMSIGHIPSFNPDQAFFKFLFRNFLSLGIQGLSKIFSRSYQGSSQDIWIGFWQDLIRFSSGSRIIFTIKILPGVLGLVDGRFGQETDKISRFVVSVSAMILCKSFRSMYSHIIQHSIIVTRIMIMTRAYKRFIKVFPRSCQTVKEKWMK